MTGPDRIPTRFLFAGQLQHLLLLAGLIPGAVFLALPVLDGASWLGISDTAWLWAAILAPVVHQIVVWFVFRTQLVFSLFTRLFGRYDLHVWGLIFMPLLLLRPLVLLGLGLSDAGSLAGPRALQITLAIILLAPALYALWSVGRYFGLPRALGGDHFRQAYREMPLVRKGAFQYSDNAMYTFAFLGLWSIALFTGSTAALALALFQHAYIWVHMYTVETPDMQAIYGNRW